MMQRYRYPLTWEQLAYAAKERAGWMCEECLIPHGAIVRSPRTGNPYVVYLQAAHVNHDHENDYPLLKAVCPTCHARYYRKRKKPVSALAFECKKHRALLVRWRKQQQATKKASPTRLAATRASSETGSRNQLKQPPFYSNRVRFAWQLDEQEGGR
jgi:hypothetical protein